MHEQCHKNTSESTKGLWSKTLELSDNDKTNIGVGWVSCRGAYKFLGYVSLVRQIWESGRSPGEGNGNPLQYSCLENPMNRGAWWATVNGVAKESDKT